MPEEFEKIPPFAWYQNFYEKRVMPKIVTEMEGTDGIFTWLAEKDPELYNRIEEADATVNSLWLSRAKETDFSDACKAWYTLLMEAKKKFIEHKAKEREALLSAGKQEALALK